MFTNLVRLHSWKRTHSIKIHCSSQGSQKAQGNLTNNLYSQLSLRRREAVFPGRTFGQSREKKFRRKPHNLNERKGHRDLMPETQIVGVCPNIAEYGERLQSQEE